MTLIPYDTHFNRDNVLFRNVLIGALASLNRFVFWINRHEDGTTTNVEVPFYFSTTGDERFLKDVFMNDIDYNPDGCAAETFYNKIPRAIVTMEGFSITDDALTNKYVRGEHIVESDDGEMKTYSSEFYITPIEMNLEVTGFLSSHTDILKFSQSVIKTFHKNLLYHIEFEQIRVPCTIEFSSDIGNERTFEFGFTDKKEYKVTFSLIVRFRYPVIRQNTSIFSGTRMGSFPCSIFVGSNGQVQAVTTNGVNVPLVPDQFGNLQPIDPDLIP